MSFPNIPTVNPVININKSDAVNLLLASIAFEELGLSHIINSEAEKIQYVLGTLNNQVTPEPPTIEDLIQIDDSVNRMLKNVIKNQMLLQFKLEDIINYEDSGTHGSTHVNRASVTAVFNNIIYSDSDSAYYHTEGGPSI